MLKRLHVGRFKPLTAPQPRIASVSRFKHILHSSSVSSFNLSTLYPRLPHTISPRKYYAANPHSVAMLPPSTDPLVWIDCEMTGLDPTSDVILQIVCFITTYDLTLLEPAGLELIIHHPKSTLDAMGPWCQRTHAATGLTSKVLASTLTPSEAAAQLLKYIKSYVPEPQKALLAGNSIHADRMFLTKICPDVIGHLHYRILDVSTIKECVRRWCGQEIRKGAPVKKELHEARQDVLESIEEMRYYKEILFDNQE